MEKVLRPHHGMCFLFYEGKGYSEDFTDHMGRIIRQMEEDPGQIVTLKAETDIVCEHCPNNVSGTCTSSDKVARYDRAVLEECGFNEGDKIPYSQFKSRVNECIISAGVRSKICGDCTWNEICSGRYHITGSNSGLRKGRTYGF